MYYIYLDFIQRYLKWIQKFSTLTCNQNVSCNVLISKTSQNNLLNDVVKGEGMLWGLLGSAKWAKNRSVSID